LSFLRQVRRKKKRNFDYYFTLLSTPQIKNILNKIEELIKKMQETGFERLYIPKEIDLYVCKSDKKNLVPKEKQEIWGAPMSSDEIARIKSTIEEKVEQFKKCNPGILLIFEPFFLYPLDSKNINNPAPFYSFCEKIFEDLKETINEFSELSAIIIYINKSYFTEKGFFKKSEKNYTVIKENKDKFFRSKNRLIIFNEFAKYPLTAAEKKILEII